MTTAITCNDANFEAEVSNSDAPVLIDFWAPWCGPCQAVAPIVDEIAHEYGAQVKVLKINVDDAPQAAAQFGVTSIPSFTVIKDGQVKARLAGVRAKQALVEAITPHMN